MVCRYSNAWSLQLGISVAGVALLLLGLFFLGRSYYFIKEARSTPRNASPEWEDWSETRNWVWVVTSGIIVSGILFVVSAAVWGWQAVVFYRDGSLLTLGSVMLGLVFEMYVLHRLGMDLV